MSTNSKKRTNLIICAVLLTCAVSIYSIKIAVYGNIHGSFMFIFHALGILPVNLLLMTFIFNKLLTVHNKAEKKQKRDMLVGVFFSECGCKIVRLLAKLDKNRQELNECSHDLKFWEEENQPNILTTFEQYKSDFYATKEDLAEIQKTLNGQHRYFLSLIDHPALVEHGAFSDLIWGLFHLEDELNHRPDLSKLPESDIEHLAGDIARVYENILVQWVNHIIYLKNNYPYLFSLAIRTSPFKPDCCAVISG